MTYTFGDNFRFRKCPQWTISLANFAVSIMFMLHANMSEAR